ncbi:3-hydroxyacyl-CoA dehydrogenase family protein [Singulisphaera sp. Ch08]|uniref:3-hydroxyacyl-CoA dehydrogenase family protein n=1 Tax=Singulisphaera sp. Ch08 TaxID=3120278 RepID=A0AAU7CMH6_9BACT
MDAERVGVVGLGLLGQGIAACFVAHGFTVVAVDRTDEQHAAARQGIEQAIEELVARAGFDPDLRQAWSSRYLPAVNFENLQACSFVVESVTEEAMTKEQVFDLLEAVVDPRVIIASNTSAIPITRLQQGRTHPARFVGMHWAQPAHLTRFMEVIRGELTSESVFQATAALARRIGKEPSLCQKDVPGFIVNRIGYAMYREALHLLDSGVADAETIDRSMRNALGLWASICGPLRWIDISGGPELYARAMEPVLPTLSKADELSPSLRTLADAGARGIQNGRGFYDYSPEDAKLWQERYRQHAWEVSQSLNQSFPLDDEGRAS